MPNVITAIVDSQTNEFDSSGRLEDGRYVRVALPRNPDPLREKYSGDPLNPFLAKTALEIQASKDAQADAAAAQRFDGQDVIKATVICSLWGRLGRQPTAQEITAERTRFINILKTLT